MRRAEPCAARLMSPLCPLAHIQGLPCGPTASRKKMRPTTKPFLRARIIVVAPLAGRAREGPERFEDEPAHSALRRILRHHIEFDEVRKVERRELRPIGMGLAMRFKIGHAALHDRPYKLAE